MNVFEDQSKVIVAGHRGIKSKYPENTLLSFKEALDLGVDMIEFDLNITKDKHIVVIHDNTLDRTTNGTGYVHDYNLAEIKTLDAGIKFGKHFEGLKIPTLVEFCELIKPYPNLLLNVEIKEKTHECVDLSMQILSDYNLIERSVFTCFDASIISYMYDRYHVRTQGFPKEKMYNFEEGENGTYSKLYAVGIEMSLLTPELVSYFESINILPWCYCPDTDDLVIKALTCNIRLITANNPEPSLRILKKVGLHN